MQKIRRAVQWVYHPDQSFGDDVRAELLADDASISGTVLEHASDYTLRRAIDLGDEVAPSLQSPPGGAVGSLHRAEIVRRLLGR
jgi:hypothetical protein